MSRAAFAPASDLAQASMSRPAASGLRVNKPGDAYEVEADRAAERVVSGAGRNAGWSLSKIGMSAPLQRECSCGGQCEECGKDKKLQRKPHGGAAPETAPPIVHEVLRGPGRPMEPSVRGFMEARFGHDFSRVRIFHDDAAATSAQSVSAKAYTVGSKIVFGHGKYTPESPGGRRLLAHELAHVVQQAGGVSREAELSVGPANGKLETEANAAAATLGGLSPMASQPLPSLTRAGAGLIQRQPAESSGPTGWLDKARYLLRDEKRAISPARWKDAKRCLESLFDSMVKNSFDSWIPIACKRTPGGILHSRNWDAFGHCWIGCEGTRQCGGAQTAAAGAIHEAFREFQRISGTHPHDSLVQDTANQLIGRVASIKGGTCFSICDGLHSAGHLDLSAPVGTCVDCAKPDQDEGPCPGTAANGPPAAGPDEKAQAPPPG